MSLVCGGTVCGGPASAGFLAEIHSRGAGTRRCQGLNGRFPDFISRCDAKFWSRDETCPVCAELQTCPDLFKRENETGDSPFTRNAFRVRYEARFACSTINVNALVIAIDQPSQFHAVLRPEAHLLLRCGKAVTGGHDFNHKLRNKPRELSQLAF